MITKMFYTLKKYLGTQFWDSWARHLVYTGSRKTQHWCMTKEMINGDLDVEVIWLLCVEWPKSWKCSCWSIKNRWMKSARKSCRDSLAISFCDPAGWVKTFPLRVRSTGVWSAREWIKSAKRWKLVEQATLFLKGRGGIYFSTHFVRSRKWSTTTKSMQVIMISLFVCCVICRFIDRSKIQKILYCL